METPPASVHWPDQATRGERPSHHESSSEEQHSSLPPRRILGTNSADRSPGGVGELDLEVTFGKQQEKGSDGSESEDGLMSGLAEDRSCAPVVAVDRRGVEALGMGLRVDDGFDSPPRPLVSIHQSLTHTNPAIKTNNTINIDRRKQEFYHPHSVGLFRYPSESPFVGGFEPRQHDSRSPLLAVPAVRSATERGVTAGTRSGVLMTCTLLSVRELVLRGGALRQWMTEVR